MEGIWHNGSNGGKLWSPQVGRSWFTCYAKVLNRLPIKDWIRSGLGLVLQPKNDMVKRPDCMYCLQFNTELTFRLSRSPSNGTLQRLLYTSNNTTHIAAKSAKHWNQTSSCSGARPGKWPWRPCLVDLHADAMRNLSLVPSPPSCLYKLSWCWNFKNMDATLYMEASWNGGTSK